MPYHHTDTDTTSTSSSTGTSKPLAPKKKIRPLKKAPQAPKRFKSSYILFFIDVQQKIKESLPAGQASVSIKVRVYRGSALMRVRVTHVVLKILLF